METVTETFEHVMEPEKYCVYTDRTKMTANKHSLPLVNERRCKENDCADHFSKTNSSEDLIFRLIFLQVVFGRRL